MGTRTKEVPSEERSATLSSEQTAQVFRLLKGADSVELKLSVPDRDRRSAVASLRMDPLDAQIRQVMFFDTPDLALNRHGVVVRARRVQGKSGDTVVKLRPLIPDETPGWIRKSPHFSIELDAVPGGYVCSGSMKSSCDDRPVKEVMGGDRRLSKLLSKDQRGLFVSNGPTGAELDDLTRLGPVNVLKLKFNPKGFGRRLVAELWYYPDGSRILELSTKCEPSEAFQVAAETRDFLTRRGIDLFAEQQTKTKTALEFFVGELSDDDRSRV